MHKVIALGTNGVETLFGRVQREMGALPEQMPGKEEGRRDSEDDQEQGKTSQQLLSLAPRRFNEGTSASSLELDLTRVLGVHLVKAEEQEIQVQQRIEQELCPSPLSR